MWQMQLSKQERKMSTIKKQVSEAICSVGTSPTKVTKYISEKYPETNLASVGYELWKQKANL